MTSRTILAKPVVSPRSFRTAADGGLGPEAAAVLADTPAFAVRLALPLCFQKQIIGNAGVAILVGMKDRVMRPDDLVAIADQPARAEIPVRHPPVRVEHEDGVIGDAFHQQAKALLAAPQRLGFAAGPFCGKPVIHGGGEPDDEDRNRGAGDQEARAAPDRPRRVRRGRAHAASVGRNMEPCMAA